MKPLGVIAVLTPFGPVLLALTHRSRWDPVVLCCATPRLLRFMASHDDFLGLQGWFMRHLGAFPVNTRRPTPGALRHCRDLILAGEALVIFPEGTIFYYPPHHIHPIKPGSAWLALECQEQMPDAPFLLIPIRIVYSNRYPRFRTRVQLLVQEPISLGSYFELPRRVGLRQLTAELQSRLGDVVNDSLRRRSKITSAIHRKLAKNACFSGVLASVVPASLLKLFLSAASPK